MSGHNESASGNPKPSEAPRDGSPAFQSPPPAIQAACRECGGSGRIVLFTSSHACARCAGLGWLAAVPGELVEGPRGSFAAYDEQGRVVQMTMPAGVVITHYEYDAQSARRIVKDGDQSSL